MNPFSLISLLVIGKLFNLAVSSMNTLSVDCEEIETLVYKRLDGIERGWRVELLVEQLANELEEKFLLCSYCCGLARDACVMEKEGKHELRCSVCIPEGVTWHKAQMNGELIKEKLIMCPLNERGCDWRDKVTRGMEHVKECEFLLVLCPLKCVESEGERSGEVTRVERRLMPEHEMEYCPQRELTCEFCGCGVRACEMSVHLGDCSEFPVDCPNGCEVAEESGARQVKRGDVPLHLSECPLQTVKCTYWDYGCGEEMERRHLDLHEREAMHIHFNLSMKEMKRNQTESNGQILFLVKLNAELKNNLTLANNKIKSLEQLALAKDLEVTLLRKEIAVSVESVSLQLEQKQQIANNELRENLKQTNDRLYKLAQASKDNDLMVCSVNKELKALIDTLSCSLVPTAILQMNIKGVKRKIEQNQRTYSDPFFVGLYKCQGYIDWDCDRTGRLGCGVCIVKGEFDDTLKWPFIYRQKFILLNQNKDGCDHILLSEITKEALLRNQRCFQRPTSLRNVGYGHSSFISHLDLLLTVKYCRDDSISIHIIMDQFHP